MSFFFFETVQETNLDLSGIFHVAVTAKGSGPHCLPIKVSLSQPQLVP